MNNNKTNNTPEQRHVETLVSDSTLRINDLRIGNIVLHITNEGDAKQAIIAWHHLRWLTDDPNKFSLHYKPIPLTEDVLIKLSFKKVANSEKWEQDGIVWGKEYLQLNKWYKNAYDAYFMIPGFNPASVSFNSRPIKYVHQLQNLYYSLTGEELVIER
jgi:hypothetical protein